MGRVSRRPTAGLRWALGLLLAIATVARAGDGVPAKRLAALARGVNLSHWLWLPQGRTAAERDAWFTPSDARRLRDMGLTHVRLPFEPEAVWDRSGSVIREEGCGELERAIARCTDAGLAVVVDAHPRAAPWLEPDADRRFNDLEAMWSALALRLAPTNPERVFLEIVNEPHDLKDAAVWSSGQERLVAVIRRAAPRHTIIATGDEWGSIGGLLRLRPVSDTNVVYSFHFYEPHDFTHQGATWGAKHWRHLKGLPYPSSPEAVKDAAKGIDDEQAAAVARRYGLQQWGTKRITDEINKAAAWAREHRVPIYCGEFGTYKEAAPRESRLAWIRDVRAALGAAGIGYAMWDYAGGFALMEGKPGARTADAGVAEALEIGPP